MKARAPGKETRRTREWNRRTGFPWDKEERKRTLFFPSCCFGWLDPLWCRCPLSTPKNFRTKHTPGHFEFKASEWMPSKCALLRMQLWRLRLLADGFLATQGLARKLATNLVIWKYTRNTWETYLLQSYQTDTPGTCPAMCLCSKDGHYRFLKRPQNELQLWLPPVESLKSPWELRGAGPGCQKTKRSVVEIVEGVQNKSGPEPSISVRRLPELSLQCKSHQWVEIL